MKKFALTALAAATMLGAGAAHAYTTGTYSNGFVVPHVYHNGAGDTTAIGVTNRTGESVPVYWAFFDVDSNKLLDGCFPMTDNAFKPFIWNEEDHGGLVNVHGYMVFAAGNAKDKCDQNSIAQETEGWQFNGQINGAAYQVTTNNMNAETVPTLTGPLWFQPGTDLKAMKADSLEYVGGAFDTYFDETAATVRFYNPGHTEWVIWSTGDQTAGKGSTTLQTYNWDQARSSTSLFPKNKELNIIDVKDSDGQIGTWAYGFREGFSVIQAEEQWDSWYAYARIAQADGANIQTYLGVQDAYGPLGPVRASVED